MNSEVNLIQVTAGCAKWKKVPIFFVAKVVAETTKAFYLYGHGTTETIKMGVCCVCGRTLTHPVSVELGIGPECGSHWWDWSLVGGYTKENVARLMQKIRTDIIIDTWIPKGLVVSMTPSTEIVTIPTDHPLLNVKTEVPIKVTSLAENKYGDRLIKISFPYNVTDLDLVRSLAGRRYNADDKCWTVPVSTEAIESLKGWGFVIDPRLDVFLQKKKISVNDVAEIEVPGLRGQLFPFQKKGVAFIENRNGCALIADEMGTGKTVQALAYLQLHPELRPALIVVPASLKLNWKREAEYWMPDPKVEILSGTSMHKLTGEIIVINYDILADWLPTLKALESKVLIIDESHMIKSSKARRTKAVKQLAKGIPHRIGLSGTPIVNRPIEARNAINIIDSSLFPNGWDFVHRYCDAKQNRYGWDFSGASNTQELHEKLVNSIMIRRKKSDVLTDLPDKIRSFIPIELDNETDYSKAEADFVSFVRKTKGQAAADRASNAATLAEIEGLKQLAVTGKLKECINWITDFIEVDGKLVVFATHRFVIDALIEAFPGISVKIDGGVTGEDRQKAVDDFQNNSNIRLFVGNIQAAGVGITLTAASNVAFLELPWTPGALVQAEDRCHRIGQKCSVNIHYLLASGTIEEKIAALIDKKRRVLDAVLDGKETDQESLLTELMKEYE